MSWWKDIVKYAAPVIGAAGGSLTGGALGIGADLGGAIGGGLGGFLGGELGGSSVGGSLLEGGLGAAGGYFAGPTIANWAGMGPGASVALPGASATGVNPSMITGELNGEGSSWNDSLGVTPAAGGIAGVGQGAAGAATGAAADAAAGAGGGGGFMNFLKSNPALLATGAGLVGQLASPALAGSTTPNYPGEHQLKSIANNAEQQGKLLTSYAATGKLPPGAQAAVDIASRDAEAAIKAFYANQGLSGSTMEAQDLAAARERASALGYQLGMQAVQQGMSQLGLAQQIYAGIMDANMKSDSDLSQSIIKLAGATGYGQGTQPGA